MSRPIWYDSAETGAPTLNNAAGSLLEVLRACLINGFNLKSVTSIVVASGVATATAATHGYSAAYGKLLRIEGAPVAGLNGDVQPLTVDANTFTYAATGVPDGTYTGSISARRAPLGWTEIYTGTGKAVFAPSVPEATPNCLRVDDSGAASMARVVGVPRASISGVDSFSGEYPSAAQISGGGYWQKGANTATAKAWILVGDERGFYLLTQIGTGSSFVPYFFGDIIPFYPGDVGGSLLAGQTTSTVSTGPNFGLATGSPSGNAPAAGSGMYAPRGVLASELTPVFQAICGSYSTAQSGSSGQIISASTYPNPVIHNGIYVISAGPCIRGQIPGLGHLLAAGYPLSVPEVVNASGRTFLLVSISSGSGGAGILALNLSGWR